MYNPPVEDLEKYRLTGWAKKNSKKSFDLELPSGQTVLMKSLEINDIMRLGLLNKLDSFTGALMQETGKKGKKKDNTDLAFLKKLSDPEKFASLEEVLDKITVECVIMPRVHPMPEGDSAPELPEGAIYVDQVDFLDKLGIFESAFEGISDLSDFRKPEGADLGTVADVKEVPSSSE